MALDPDETIAALASPPGPAERGIIRVSGRNTVALLQQLLHKDSSAPALGTLKRATRLQCSLHVPQIGLPVPTDLLVWPTSRSYTGQPAAEIHMVGSPPLLDAVLERLHQLGTRPAQRGEFTMRAFLAGRIDLVQAEGVLGVIDAADHVELTTALQQLGGGITEQFAEIRQTIIALLGDLEAGLDFVEEDIEFVTHSEITQRLTDILQTLNRLAEGSQSRLPSGYQRRIVLAGLPNAGKSTLFNCLTGQQRAIVSPIAGTTRDYLSANIPIHNVEAELIDTAGEEAATTVIMNRAQQLRSEQLSFSDLIVWCTAADLTTEQLAENQQLRQQASAISRQVIDVITRIDVHPVSPPQDAIAVSVPQGTGIDQLKQTLAASLKNDQSTRSELLFSTASRCRDSLRRAIESIQAALAAVNDNMGDEVIAIELRTTLHELGMILGEVYTDDILDHIFSNFCIGK
jgi:tRNA modification GTPase